MFISIGYIFTHFLWLLLFFVMLFFIYFMLPKFIDMFQGFSLDLPLPTRMLISIGYIFTHFWWLLIFLVIVFISVFARFRATEGGRRKLDKWKMTVPVLGKVVK